MLWSSSPTAITLCTGAAVASGVPALPGGGANIFSHAYCSLLVSWNSSTSTWLKRRR